MAAPITTVRRRERASGSRASRPRTSEGSSATQTTWLPAVRRRFRGPPGAVRRRHHRDVGGRQLVHGALAHLDLAARARPRPGSARRGLRTTTTSESTSSAAASPARHPRPDGPQPDEDGPHSVQLVGRQLPPPTPLGRGPAVTPQPHDGRHHDRESPWQSTSVARPSSTADASGLAQLEAGD